MFDLDKNDSYREPTKAEIRAERDVEYNKRMKSTMRFVGENLATYAVVLATTVLVGSVFGEMSLNIFSGRMLADFILTVAVFMLVEYLISQNGIGCGKTYDEYIVNHNRYLEMREAVYKRGIALMDMFCDWQVDIEYEYYIRRMCKDLKIDYKDYTETYSKMSLEELRAMFCSDGAPRARFSIRHPILSFIGLFKRVKQSDTAAKIFSLRLVRHTVLTPEILLTDGKPRRSRGGVGISGEEYIEKKTVGGGHIAVSIITALISVLPTITWREMSWLLIFYALLKLIGVFFRGSRGYMKGAKAFNTIDVKRLQDQMQYLNLYHEFLDKKIYLELEDKYGALPLGIKKEEALTYDNKQCDSEGGCIENQCDRAGAEIHLGV